MRYAVCVFHISWPAHSQHARLTPQPWRPPRAGCPDLDACAKAVLQSGTVTIGSCNASSPSTDNGGGGGGGDGYEGGVGVVVASIPLAFDPSSIPSAAELHVGVVLALTPALLAQGSSQAQGVSEPVRVQNASPATVALFLFGAQPGQCPRGRHGLHSPCGS